MADKHSPQASSEDAEKAAPASARKGAQAQSRNGAKQRRNWARFLVDEWSLLLLAAGMTLTSWLIVAKQVVTEHRIEDVWVELAVDAGASERLGAVFTAERNKIDVLLLCSKREYNEAVQALVRSGRKTVTLRIGQIPRGESRSFSLAEDTYDWPFDAQRILRSPPEPPAGRVFKLSNQTAFLAIPMTEKTPEELEAEGVRVDIKPEVKNFPLNGPEGVFDENKLVADKVHIDPQEFEPGEDGSYGAPRPITLTFEEWRSQADSEPWRKAYRAQVKLPQIKAMVTLTSIGRAEIPNRLRVLADMGEFEFDFDDVKARHKSITGLRELTYSGALTGPKRVLDALGQSKGLWSWGIRFATAPETRLLEEGAQPDSQGYYSLEGEIVWLPYGLPKDGGFANRGVRFERRTGEGSFDVKFKPRKKP